MLKLNKNMKEVILNGVLVNKAPVLSKSLLVSVIFPRYKIINLVVMLWGYYHQEAIME